MQADLSWAFKGPGPYKWKAAGQSFEVRSPSPRQLEIMRKHVLTDTNIEELRRYFTLLGVREGQSLLDVGANIGYMALAYSAALPGSEIVAFEPSDVNFECLSFNTGQRRSILPQKIGLHHERSQASLRMPSGTQNSRASSKNYRNTGLFSMYGEGEEVSAAIELVTLDGWLETYSKRDQIGFAKIDVEGNELNVLRGAKTFLSRQAPVLEVELNPDAPGSSRGVFLSTTTFLKDFGYRAFVAEKGHLTKLESAPSGNVNAVFMKTNGV